MFDYLLIAFYLIALAYFGWRSYFHPQGIYRKVILAVMLFTVANLGFWTFASFFISDAAGLGAFLIMIVIQSLAMLAALIVVATATLRHAVNRRDKGNAASLQGRR